MGRVLVLLRCLRLGRPRACACAMARESRRRERKRTRSHRPSCSRSSSSCRSSSSRSLSSCLCTRDYGGGAWHAQRVSDACAARAAEVASALQRVREPDAHAAGRPTVSQWPVTRARHQCILKARASLVARACGEARVCGDARVQCVRQACSVRACSCARRRAERRRAGKAADRKIPVRALQ